MSEVKNNILGSGDGTQIKTSNKVLIIQNYILLKVSYYSRRFIAVFDQTGVILQILLFNNALLLESL